MKRVCERYQFGVALLLLPAAILTMGLCLTGCPAASTTTPAAPANPPQVQVLQYAQLATAAGDTAAHVLVALCVPQPPATTTALDLATCNQVKTDLLTIKSAVDQIVVEANKVPAIEPWTTARINIAMIGANVTLGAVVPNPALQSDVAGLEGFIKQILGVQ